MRSQAELMRPINCLGGRIIMIRAPLHSPSQSTQTIRLPHYEPPTIAKSSNRQIKNHINPQRVGVWSSAPNSRNGWLTLDEYLGCAADEITSQAQRESVSGALIVTQNGTLLLSMWSSRPKNGKWICGWCGTTYLI
jgi:hypothetical protein